MGVDSNRSFHSKGTFAGVFTIVYENEGKREFRNSKIHTNFFKVIPRLLHKKDVYYGCIN
jgi:hypothetical protein